MPLKSLNAGNIHQCMHIIPYIRYSNEDRYTQPWALAERKIFDNEFILITKGACELTIDGRLYRAEPNHLILLKPGIAHSGRSMLLPFHFFCVHFDIYVSSADSTIKVNGKYPNGPIPLNRVRYEKTVLEMKEHMVLEDAGHIALQFRRIFNEMKKGDMASGLVVKSYFVDLVVSLFREQGPLCGGKDFTPEVRKIIEYIESNYMHTISLVQLSALVHLHPSYISNLFKKQTGITLSRFITTHRVSIARNLLLETGRKIEDIALATGFYDLHQFSNVFKRIEGIAPSQYRKIRHNR